MALLCFLCMNILQYQLGFLVFFTPFVLHLRKGRFGVSETPQGFNLKYTCTITVLLHLYCLITGFISIIAHDITWIKVWIFAVWTFSMSCYSTAILITGFLSIIARYNIKLSLYCCRVSIFYVLLQYRHSDHVLWCCIFFFLFHHLYCPSCLVKL